MSWLRRHAFNVQDKNSPTESKTIFEITSDKDHIGHYLDILDFRHKSKNVQFI